MVKDVLRYFEICVTFCLRIYILYIYTDFFLPDPHPWSVIVLHNQISELVAKNIIINESCPRYVLIVVGFYVDQI